MSSPSTKEIVTLLDQAEFLGTSIRTQRGTVSPELNGVFSPPPPLGDGEPASPTNWDGVQLQNADLIDKAVLEVQEASQGHRSAKIRVSDVITERQDATTDLRKRHRAHQQILKGASGPRGLTLTGLDSSPVTTILGMREQSTLVLKQYEDPSVREKLASIPKDEAPGPVPDMDTLSGDLRDDIETFETAQSSLNQAKKVRDEAYVNKTEALDRLHRVVVNVARVQEGYYRLAGLDDLADRLRLTIRGSKSKKAKDDPSDGSSTPVPADPSDGSATPAHES